MSGEKMDWSHIANNARGVGKTTVMAEAAKKINAVLVVRNAQEAQRVRRELGVSAASVSDAHGSWGSPHAYLFDPDAVAVLCMDYERDRAALRSENARLREAVKFALAEFKVYGKDDPAIKRLRAALESATEGR